MKRGPKPRGGEPGSIEEKIRLRRQAHDHLVRAAALLLDSFDRDHSAQALFWMALAMYRLAKSDPDCEVEQRCQELIRFCAPPPRPRVPGPYSGT